MKRLKTNFRGSLRDPLLYLGIAAFILFGFASFGAQAFLSNAFEEPLFPQFIASQNSGGLFLKQKKTQQVNISFSNVLQGNSLLGISVPINISSQTLGTQTSESFGGEYDEPGNEIIEYAVQPGDNPSGLAEKFDISLNTLLWANDLSKNSKLQVGQKLIVLPVSGLIHYVKKGESLGQIAEKYKGDVEEIVAFNDVSGQEIFIGDILIIPGGIMPIAPKKVATAPPTSSFAAPTIPIVNSYFIYPTQGTLSQGLHWYNAIDIATSCGTPVYAAAQGTILKTKFSNYGLGNYIAISHPNGVVTYYGHLQSILVSPGAQVSQGQIIGLVGGKPGMAGAGTSTGCHVHFDVRGAKNPFAR